MMFIVYYGDFVMCNVLNDSSVVRLDSTICSGMSVTTDRITEQKTNPYGRNRANYGLKVILKAMYITNILVLILGGLVLVTLREELVCKRIHYCKRLMRS